MARTARIPTLKPRIPTTDFRRVKPPPKVADPELLTRDWRAMRERVIREAGGRCQIAGFLRPARYADHIVERKDGGAVFDRANLQAICPVHHGLKSAAERAKRMKMRY